MRREYSFSRSVGGNDRMWSFISDGPEGFCSLLSASGVDCSTEIFAINIWNAISGLMLFLIGWAIIAFFMRYRRLDTFHITHGVKVPYKSLDDVNIVKMHPYRMRELFEEKNLRNLGAKALTAKLNEKYENEYFIVLFREEGRTIARRELRMVAVWQKTQEHEVRTDPETMRILKKGSSSPLDDDTDDSFGVDGVFDMFVRPIRWWDVRHWFFHPNREVKIGVRVAVFITAIEYSSTIWKLLKSIIIWS